MANSLRINDEQTTGKTPDGVTSPATYKASENMPSIATPKPLLPVPKFGQPVDEALVESALSPDTVHFDSAGNVPSASKPVRGTIVGRQETGAFLLAPTRYNPATRSFEPVAPSTEQDSKPATARHVHDASKTQNR